MASNTHHRLLKVSATGSSYTFSILRPLVGQSLPYLWTAGPGHTTKQNKIKHLIPLLRLLAFSSFLRAPCQRFLISVKEIQFIREACEWRSTSISTITFYKKLKHQKKLVVCRTDCKRHILLPIPSPNLRPNSSTSIQAPGHEVLQLAGSLLPYIFRRDILTFLVFLNGIHHVCFLPLPLLKYLCLHLGHGHRTVTAIPNHHCKCIHSPSDNTVITSPPLNVYCVPKLC